MPDGHHSGSRYRRTARAETPFLVLVIILDLRPCHRVTKHTLSLQDKPSPIAPLVRLSSPRALASALSS